MGRTNHEYVAYFNGEWMPLSEVRIHPMDSGFVVGDVVFDMGRTFDGRSFRLKEHVDRLYRSLKFVRIDPGMSSDEMIALSEEALQRNAHLRGELEDLTVRQFVTRGGGCVMRPSSTCGSARHERSRSQRQGKT